MAFANPWRMRTGESRSEGGSSGSHSPVFAARAGVVSRVEGDGLLVAFRTGRREGHLHPQAAEPVAEGAAAGEAPAGIEQVAKELAGRDGGAGLVAGRRRRVRVEQRVAAGRVVHARNGDAQGARGRAAEVHREVRPPGPGPRPRPPPRAWRRSRRRKPPAAAAAPAARSRGGGAAPTAPARPRGPSAPRVGSPVCMAVSPFRDRHPGQSGDAPPPPGKRRSERFAGPVGASAGDYPRRQQRRTGAVPRLRRPAGPGRSRRKCLPRM